MLRFNHFHKQVECILLFHIIRRYTHALLKRVTIDMYVTTWVCFSTRLFVGCARHQEASTWHGSKAFHRYLLHLMLCFVTGTCGGLFSIWLELGVPLGVFSYCISIAATPALLTKVAYLKIFYAYTSIHLALKLVTIVN